MCCCSEGIGVNQAHPESRHFRTNAACVGRPRNHARGVGFFLAAVRCDHPSSQSVRAVRGARARRARYFRARLFADPAWDMLLELYVADLEQRRISVGSLCSQSQVPLTTGLRWIGALADENLITKRCDPLDARRVHVSLSPEGLNAMSAYFASVSADLPAL